MSTSRTPIHLLASPAAVALLGASPQAGTLGNGLLKNLVASRWADKLHLINPKYREIDGQVCYRSLDEIPGSISLALIAAPTEQVPALIQASAKRGARAAVVFSSGFDDDAEGEGGGNQYLQEVAARCGVRVFGPKAFGYILPPLGLNVTPVQKAVPAGNLAFVSQSGAICAGIMDWRHNDEFGFSAMFAPGMTQDLDLPEILDYLATDRHTECVLLYLEGLRDPRRFLSSVRALASTKPVIAVRAGTRPISARVVQARSGVRVGSDEAFDTALRRAGVLRVRGIGEMFSAARALTTPRKPKGNRLAVVSNGGGPAVLAADLAADTGISLASLSDATQARLHELMPRASLLGNPVDTLFDVHSDAFVEALSLCMEDDAVDGVLAVVAPNTFVDPTRLAQSCIERFKDAPKPLLACWTGETQVAEARRAFAQARMPTFRTPENAVLAYAFMVDWVRNQALLQETPPALSSYLAPDFEQARHIVQGALDLGRRKLSQRESQTLLRCFHIPVAAADADESARRAQARDLRITLTRDRAFGPVIGLSEGGLAAQIYAARAIALPPLNARLADKMLDTPYMARLIGPLPQRPAIARAPLRDALLRISEMTSELPWLHSMEVSPLLVDEHGLLALGAHIELQPLEVAKLNAAGHRYPHMAICPYPTHLIGERTLKDGSQCVIRPIRPEDAQMLQGFVRGLSARSKFFRFFGAVDELPASQLGRFTQIDYGRDMTLVATETSDGQTHMLGEANYALQRDGRSCEFAIIVGNTCGGKGLGGVLMRALMDAARQQGISEIHGEVMADNEPMLGLMESLDFIVSPTEDERVVRVWQYL